MSDETTRRKLVLLGVGNTAEALLSICLEKYDSVYATTRDGEKASALQKRGIQPILLTPGAGADICSESLEVLEEASASADVLASFPPDGSSDEKLSLSVSRARRIVYISSTGVYGASRGVVDLHTRVEPGPLVPMSRIDAERTWSNAGATILRAPALYGPAYGLHKRLMDGRFRLPGDGSRHSSRIHLHDLARIIYQVLSTELRRNTYPVGDKRPAPLREVVDWLCNRLSLPYPESVPYEQAHRTMQADRQVDGSALLDELELELIFPTYVEGFEHCLSQSS